jgi:hypothetical protein
MRIDADLVERLRVRAGDERRNYYGSVDAKLDVEAADKIERQRAALERIVSIVADKIDDHDGNPNDAMRVFIEIIIEAQVALTGREADPT